MPSLSLLLGGLILNEESAIKRQRRPALLLYLVETDVQGIFSTLPNTGDAKDCKKALDALNVYFVPQVDTMDASRCSRQLTQAPGETIRQFATKLRRAVKYCNYGEGGRRQTTRFVMKYFASVVIRTLRKNDHKKVVA